MPVSGAFRLTRSDAVVTWVVTHFSSFWPAAVVRVAQLVTGPGRNVLNTAWIWFVWPGGKALSVQTSCLPSTTLAGGCDRTYCNPSGIRLVIVMNLLSIRPA